MQGAGFAGLITLSVTMVGAASGWLPAGWPLVAGAILAVAAAVTAAWQAAPGQVLTYRAACWLGAGGWSTWTLTYSTPWSRWPLILLATGVAVAAVVGTGLVWLEERERPEPAEPAPPRGRDPVVARWEQRIRQITRREVTIARADRWDPPTGFTLHGTLPGDGTTVGDIKAYEAQLASAANLPPGCNVEVLGTDRGRRSFTIRVATVNAMAQTQHLPQDTSPLSIDDPLPVGIYADRSAATINLRFSSGVLVGQKGSGKSNILNVITHQLVRCPDVLVWAIDLSGNGRFPRPWVRPWHEGHCDVPAIDWAAVTAEDAELMCLAAINVINARTAAYQQLMHEANDDKIPASPDVPQIIILADEFGTLPESVKASLTTISDTGRGAAVQVMACALRANASYIPRDMIVQARERIAMRVTDETELQYLFDATWSRGRFDPASIPYEGSGMLATGAVPPAPYKAWRAEPNRIAAAAVAVARLRPRFDEVSMDVADTIRRRYRNSRGDWVTDEVTDAYKGRWERTLPLMFPEPGRVPPGSPQTAAAGTATATAAPPRPVTKEEPVNLEESAEQLRRAQEAARAAKEQAEAEAEHDAEPEADWSVVEGWLADASPGRPQTPPRARMREIVREHRRDGIGPRAVHRQLEAEGYGTAEQTVITWMRRDAERGILAQPGGRGQPYVIGPKFTLEQE